MKTSLKLAALLAITLPTAHAQDFEDFDNYRAEPNQWLGLKDKKFHLNSTNDQGNICDIEGDLKNNRWEDGEGCTIDFSFLENGNIKVSVPDSASMKCREYCGFNAGFEGTYRPEPAQCSDKGTEQMEAKFQAAYRAKRYSEAIKIKETYLQQCKTFVHWLDELGQRNDLAISYYHAGDNAQCRATLQPAVKIVDNDEGVSPILRESFEKQKRAVQFNLNKCK